jgi:hypothetical protein
MSRVMMPSEPLEFYMLFEISITMVYIEGDPKNGNF